MLHMFEESIKHSWRDRVTGGGQPENGNSTARPVAQSTGIPITEKKTEVHQPLFPCHRILALYRAIGALSTIANAEVVLGEIPFFSSLTGPGTVCSRQ